MLWFMHQKTNCSLNKKVITDPTDIEKVIGSLQDISDTAN